MYFFFLLCYGAAILHYNMVTRLINFPQNYGEYP